MRTSFNTYQEDFNYHETKIDTMKVFYECECGKRYDAFPALYLHFKRKHNKKISSNPLPQHCKVRLTNYSKVLTYLHSQSNNEETSQGLRINDSFHRKLKLMFEDFLKNEQFEEAVGQIITKIVEQFFQFIEDKLENHQNEFEGLFMERLPFYFNDFVLHQIKNNSFLRTDLEVEKKAFISLGKWLNKKGYTQLIVMPNEDFKFEIEKK